jgi:hypothetical protein
LIFWRAIQGMVFGMLPGMAGVATILPLAGMASGAIGILIGTICFFSLRRHRVGLEHTREEFHILLRQHQTEFQDGIGTVSRAVESLQQSAEGTEAALRGRLTPSLRGHAIQLLRSGMSADSAAASAGIPRRDMQLIARVSRILSSHQ